LEGIKVPIYIDRHDLYGTLSKAVSDAHQKDLKLQDKYGIKMLTYWFDEERGSTFCLVDAPAEEKVRQLHEEAHGSIPHKIMEVNPETVKAFLGRIEDPQPPAGFNPVTNHLQVDSAFRAIMFTDMKGSTALTTHLGDIEALEIFRSHNAITREELKTHYGREIQHTGDGFLASFTSASSAVACAISINKAFAARGCDDRNKEITVRTGICAGEPVEEDNRLFGSTVQLTSRLCDHAEPKQILVAPVVKELCLGKGFKFIDRGEEQFKGFDQVQRVYEVEWQTAL
jgi:class 3 adenylate cyclase